MSITNSPEKKRSCLPAVRKPRAIPPRPMSVPPTVTKINPEGASFSRTTIMGTRKIVKPNMEWNSGRNIFDPPMISKRDKIMSNNPKTDTSR